MMNVLKKLLILIVSLSLTSNSILAIEHNSKDSIPDSDPLNYGNLTQAGGNNCHDCNAIVHSKFGKEFGYTIDGLEIGDNKAATKK